MAAWRTACVALTSPAADRQNAGRSLEIEGQCSKTGAAISNEAAQSSKMRDFALFEVETRHNRPSPFTIHQGFHPNPALLRDDQTWRRTTNEDEGIA